MTIRIYHASFFTNLRRSSVGELWRKKVLDFLTILFSA
jgi:hypothetical protein